MEVEGGSSTNCLQIFSQAIDAHEAKGLHKKFATQTPQDKSYFCLYEDLLILLAFAEKSVDASVKPIEILVQGNLKHRSPESIRGRYKDYIRKINSDDLQTILKFVVEKKSIEGYLVLDKATSRIQVQENLKHASRQQQQQQIGGNSSGNGMQPLDEKLSSEQKKLLFQGKGNNNRQSDETGKNAQQQQNQHQNQQLQGGNESNGAITSFAMLPEDIKDARELDFYMTFLANYENVQKKSLIHVLDKLSGDLNALVDYLETHNQNLLWKEDEDNLLRTFDQLAPSTIYLLKTMKKGKANILRRAEYLGIKLPEFE